jgi:hypothetical protein
MKISDLLLQIQNPDAPGGKDFKDNSKNAFRTYVKFNAANNGPDAEHDVEDLYARVGEWVAWLELHFCQRTILNYIGHVKKALEVVPRLRETISDAEQKIDFLAGEMRRIKAGSSSRGGDSDVPTIVEETETDGNEDESESESETKTESEDDDEEQQEPLEDIRDELISIGTTLAQVVADKDTTIEALTADIQDLQEQVRSQRARIEKVALLAGIFHRLANVFGDDSPAKASYIVMLEAILAELKV